MYLLDKRVSFSMFLLTVASQKWLQRAADLYFKLHHTLPKELLIITS